MTTATGSVMSAPDIAARFKSKHGYVFTLAGKGNVRIDINAGPDNDSTNAIGHIAADYLRYQALKENLGILRNVATAAELDDALDTIIRLGEK